MKPQKQFALPTMNSIFNYYDAFRRHAFPGPHASQTALAKSRPGKIKRLMEKMFRLNMNMSEFVMMVTQST